MSKSKDEDFVKYSAFLSYLHPGVNEFNRFGKMFIAHYDYPNRLTT